VSYALRTIRYISDHYLNVNAPRPAARGVEIDGGHTVHYDESDSIMGLTLLNIRRTIEAEGYVDLMLPIVHAVDAASLREALGQNPEIGRAK
jgi:hypothetical protein